jgi:sec-independent protein translocase protein TatB
LDFTELLLIFALALIVLGPERLPSSPSRSGGGVGRARAMARQFRDQLEEEAHNLETKMNIDPASTPRSIRRPAIPPPAASPAGPPSPAANRRRVSIPPTTTCIPRIAMKWQRSAPSAATRPTAAGELDLTSPRDDGRAPRRA